MELNTNRRERQNCTKEILWYGMGTTTCSIECTGSCGHPLVPTTDGAAPALCGQLSTGGVAADVLCVEGVEMGASICGGSDGVAVRDRDW